MLLLLLERGWLLERVDDAVDANARIALRLQLSEELAVLTLALAHDWTQHLEAGAVGHLQEPVDDLARGLPGDGAPALGAVRLADAREEQA